MKTQKLHLKAPDNWVNDPNGFIYYKGYYHLFYQYFPYGPRWGTMHWGHAISRDLVTWEHKELALYPTRREDRNGCFSGSAIEEDGKLHLVYTGVRYELVNPDDPHTCLNEQYESAQLMITSEDGFHFDNENGKEVIIPPITDPAIGDRTHTRARKSGEVKTHGISYSAVRSIKNTGKFSSTGAKICTPGNLSTGLRNPRNTDGCGNARTTLKPGAARCSSSPP